jgi:gamma-glutamylaminecyclotransferase
MRLFVYGTLRQGCTNHHLVFGSPYLGPATTAEPYVMATQKSRSFPYIFKHADFYAVPVQGEIYEINDEILRRLDILEGHPDHYRRQQVRVVSPKGKMLECEAYVLEDNGMLNEIVNGLGMTFVYVKDGDWTQVKVTPYSE